MHTYTHSLYPYLFENVLIICKILKYTLTIYKIYIQYQAYTCMQNLLTGWEYCVYYASMEKIKKQKGEKQMQIKALQGK